MPKKGEYIGPNFKEMSRQLRANFYKREKEPRRREANARLHELGVKIKKG